MENIPLYSEDLIKDLDKLYPEKCPEIGTPEASIWYYSGQRSVVKNLLTRLKKTEDNKLKQGMVVNK